MFDHQLLLLQPVCRLLLKPRCLLCPIVVELLMALCENNIGGRAGPCDRTFADLVQLSDLISNLRLFSSLPLISRLSSFAIQLPHPRLLNLLCFLPSENPRLGAGTPLGSEARLVEFFILFLLQFPRELDHSFVMKSTVLVQALANLNFFFVGPNILKIVIASVVPLGQPLLEALFELMCLGCNLVDLRQFPVFFHLLQPHQLFLVFRMHLVQPVEVCIAFLRRCFFDAFLECFAIDILSPTMSPQGSLELVYAEHAVPITVQDLHHVANVTKRYF
mmetsp:Transcript_138064/g.344719  ORF Transcript_138064/g.344719 Transcript_138064/m.344719 type:complete len:276 (+) Transcript_138064:845-1672(+)